MEDAYGLAEKPSLTRLDTCMHNRSLTVHLWPLLPNCRVGTQLVLVTFKSSLCASFRSLGTKPRDNWETLRSCMRSAPQALSNTHATTEVIQWQLSRGKGSHGDYPTGGYPTEDYPIGGCPTGGYPVGDYPTATGLSYKSYLRLLEGPLTAPDFHTNDNPFATSHVQWGGRGTDCSQMYNSVLVIMII